MVPPAGSEIVDLIDAEDQVLGTTTRRIVRTMNLLHRGVGILCRDGEGRIHVHRRTETKDVFPGLHDMFVGGVVGTGETYEQAACREIAEELGIRGPRPAHLFDHLYIGARNCSRVAVYEVRWSGPVRLQESEIEWGTFLPLEDLLLRLGDWTFVPDGLEIFWRYLQATNAVPPARLDELRQNARNLPEL
jgi:isopentenyldiphosphate isomerase